MRGPGACSARIVASAASISCHPGLDRRVFRELSRQLDEEPVRQLGAEFQNISGSI
jgi:hypothetical protein